MNEIKDMTKAERAEMWQQVAAYVEQLERANAHQCDQIKRCHKRINGLKARASAERTCKAYMQSGFLKDEPNAVEFSCGHFCLWPDEVPPKYCPDCGAKVVNTDD